jgi:ATP-dependent DNA helicase RecG
MHIEEVRALVRAIRKHGAELPDVEVKSAVGGLPKSVPETLSAFSNRGGGTLILGLDEATGFTPAPRFDARHIRDCLANACSDSVQPPIRPEIDIMELDGAPIVVAAIPELDSLHKPCYVKARGEHGGSFIRIGDGDRRLTEYEIALLHANRGQPRDDASPVMDATVEDLDHDAVTRLLDRMARRQPRAFRGIPDEIALRRLGVLVPHEDKLVPSLAGVLALGAYPQQFFPQLNVTFVVIPATSKESVPAEGPRYLDNRTLNGAIPEIVEEALAALIRNMGTRAFIRGAGREDVYDYPVEALREAVVNALMHRDYSTFARGTQIQIEMYSDRLVVRSPGGLFGPVTEEDLGEERVSSSRNSYLAALLQEVTIPETNRVVCENRGTGIPTMLTQLRRAGMTTPQFENRISRFSVTFPKHTLLSAETVVWISSLGQAGLTTAQHLALALMREGRQVSNASLRQLGFDSREATAALADLVQRGLVVKTGGRRYATYLLDAAPNQSTAYQLPLEMDEGSADTPDTSTTRRDRSAEIVALFNEGQELSLADVAEAIGLGNAMTARYLDRLVAQQILIATAPARSRHRRYRRRIHT